MAQQKEPAHFDQTYASELRRSVSSQNQFQLPDFLVNEIGFSSTKFVPITGAMVAWYYYEKEDKAVLSTDTIDRSSLEFVGVSGLSGISNEDLETGVDRGARVTIITDLPAHLHEMLTRDMIVLKPVYASQHVTLENTCVSVYPAEEYDRGELPNVQHELTSETDEDEEVTVGNFDSHTNSI